MARIFVCGDVMNPLNSECFISNELVSVIKNSDYSVCNFEGTSPFENHFSGDMIQHPTTLKTLMDSGFNLLLLANNHITDYKKEGLKSTISAIDSFGFDRIGAGFSYDEAYSPIIKEVSGIKLGIINICEAQEGQFESDNQEYGYAWLGDKNTHKRIHELKKSVDHVLVFVHAGLENYKLPLNEFRQLYRSYCDDGASCVLGCHPHISQGIERYNNSYIFYSLGNFYFPPTFLDTQEWRNSFSVVLEISKTHIGYSVLKHEVSGNMVRIVSNDVVNVEYLTSILEEPYYSQQLKQQNIDAFNKIVYRLYKESLMGTDFDDSFGQKTFFIYNYLFKQKLYEETRDYRLRVIRRLLKNETYRFLAINAINSIIKE